MTAISKALKVPIPGYDLNYNRTDYNTAGHKERSLHFLIALIQPLESIIKWCNIEQRGTERLNQPDPLNHNFTPLSLAVIYGRKKVAKKLLELGADPFQQDAFGFTFLHHAALRKDGMLETLCTKVDQTVLEKLKDIRCQFGGTWKEVREIVTEPSFAPDEIVTSINNEPCTAERFKAITGSSFCNRVHSSPENLLFHHIKFPLKQHLSPWIKIPPSPLVLADQPEIPGIGARTSRRLEANTFFAPFEGRLSDKLELAENQMGWVDAGADLRGLASFIKDGPPNCIGVDIVGFHGIRNQPLLRTTRNMEEGEIFYLDYGATHSIKTGNYRISSDGLKTLRVFFQDRQIDSYNPEEITYERYMLAYLFNTPAAFTRLALEGVINHAQLAKLGSETYFDSILKATSKSIAFVQERFPALVKDLILLQNENISARTYVAILNSIESLSVDDSFIRNFLRLAKSLDYILKQTEMEQAPFFDPADDLSVLFLLPRTWKKQALRLIASLVKEFKNQRIVVGFILFLLQDKEFEEEAKSLPPNFPMPA